MGTSINIFKPKIRFYFEIYHKSRLNSNRKNLDSRSITIKPKIKNSNLKYEFRIQMSVTKVRATNERISESITKRKEKKG